MDNLLDTENYFVVKSKLSEPVTQEYATKLTLIGLFLAVFTAFISRPHGRRRGQKEFQMKPFDLVMLGFSTLRLGRLVAYDRVAEPIRQPFAKTVPDQTGAGETVEARGSGITHSIGELLTCPICAGTWIAAGLVYGLQTLPSPTRTFMAIMSTVGVAELLNSLTEAFSWLGQAARKIAGDKN